MGDSSFLCAEVQPEQSVQPIQEVQGLVTNFVLTLHRLSYNLRSLFPVPQTQQFLRTVWFQELLLEHFRGCTSVFQDICKHMHPAVGNMTGRSVQQWIITDSLSVP